MNIKLFVKNDLKFTYRKYFKFLKYLNYFFKQNYRVNKIILMLNII